MKQLMDTNDLCALPKPHDNLSGNYGSRRKRKILGKIPETGVNVKIFLNIIISFSYINRTTREKTYNGCNIAVTKRQC